MAEPMKQMPATHTKQHAPMTATPPMLAMVMRSAHGSDAVRAHVRRAPTYVPMADAASTTHRSTHRPVPTPSHLRADGAKDGLLGSGGTSVSSTFMGKGNDQAVLVSCFIKYPP